MIERPDVVAASGWSEESEQRSLSRGPSRLPCPAPPAAPLIAPRDQPYPGLVRLSIDASDTMRGIVRGRMHLPVAGAGEMTFQYPKWMPGYHSPQNPLELLAGLVIKAGDVVLDWRRDAVEVYAFHVAVPDGTDALDIQFQFLSPTTSSQGDVVVTDDLMNLQWGRMLLYPAGYYSRRIQMQATLTLPDGWRFSSVLQTCAQEGPRVEFDPVALDVLVDSPVMAGRFALEVALDQDEAVRLCLFGHNPADLEVSPDQIRLHGNLVNQAERLFASKHFDRYQFLVALSEELGGGGVEHHRCAEIVASPSYFREWDQNLTTRDVFAHELTHSWNGKFRRAADSWTPSFEVPIRNSLMWVYEGQTQYWGHVLTARAGLWSRDMALQALAKVAATYDVRPGGRWRSMADTTRDPMIAGRAPLPWPSWQRSEDYYSEGQLLWLSVDTLVRELSCDRRSLDDFAAAFFGIDDGSMVTHTYEFADVIHTLNEIVEYDWAALITGQLRSREVGAPLDGLERGGYRLVYRDHRSDFCKSFDALQNQLDLRFSAGLNIGSDGTIQEVMWGSPAFHAGLTAGALIQKVGGQPYSEDAISQAIGHAGDAPIHLRIKARAQSRSREVELHYSDGHRFPHLEPNGGGARRLDQILSAR